MCICSVLLIYICMYTYIHTEYICIYKIMHLSVIWFLKKQINTDCYLKATLIAVQVGADGRVHELPSHQNKDIFLKQRHFSSAQQHKDCAFMYITCFQRWKIMLKKPQKPCFIYGLAWIHGWKAEYLYRTTLTKGWIRHAEYVQGKCVFIEGA